MNRAQGLLLVGAMAAGLFSTASAFAECISLVKGPIALDVNSCGVLNPEKTFDLGNAQYQFIKDLPPAERAKFYNSYRGLIVKGVVARSLAVRSGLSPEKGALNGETISVFIPPGQAQCASLNNMRLKGDLDEACCEGGGDAPCLLPSAYVLKNFKPIGKSASAAGDKARLEAEQTPEYKKAEQLFQQKDYKGAARLYEIVREKGKLDVKGHYMLGLIYRKLDQCGNAIPVLEYIFKKAGANQYWADEESMVRQANFLLARCYSKLNKPTFAQVILQSYLLDPKKYKSELRQALNHPDFGWIKTSKEYLQFRTEAEKVLVAK